jgi:light-regulated signal transduction histidine kinase (bacteriophytochrome)
VSGGSQALNERLSSMAKTKTRMIDLTLLKKTGEPMPVILSEVSIDKLDSGHGERLFSTIDNTRCHDAMERIKTLDQELEAFSYSISHDLRAPLRSIDGYSRILQEDYAERLDDEGRRVLSVVTNNAKRMGKLIDDLLTFGRLGRKPLQRSNVNMTSIVHSTVQELQAQEPGRRIQVTVSELAAASADADMLRQVWFNLMENAFKFTGKKEEPSITVRSYMLEPN